MNYTETEIEEIKSRYRDQLYQGMSYSINKFDDQILYLSSGALVLSLSFIGTIVPLEKSTWVALIYFSWGMLLVTAIVSVYTHLESYSLHGKQIERLELGQDLVVMDKKTSFRNKSMFTSLTIGIFLQVLFVIINIQHMKNENAVNNEVSTSQNTSIKIDTIKLPSPESYENLGAPVMQVPVALRPQADSTSTGTKK